MTRSFQGYDVMESLQGYYSLVQYTEYPERNEFVNIGVVLFAGTSPRVLVKFSSSARRAEKAFNVYLGVHYQYLQESLQDRLLSEFEGAWRKEQIDKFIALRSGKMRLSPRRSILVRDPKTSLEELFGQLVSDVPHRLRGTRVSTKLKNKFTLGGVDSLLEKPEPIHLAQGITIKAPYAYQNGAYNMINAVSLQNEPDKAIEKASTYAVEGEWLYESSATDNQKRLVVVGDVSGQKQNFISALSEMMERHEVMFYSMDNLELLMTDIRKNALVG
jgi:hypothetical protein